MFSSTNEFQEAELVNALTANVAVVNPNPYKSVWKMLWIFTKLKYHKTLHKELQCFEPPLMNEKMQTVLFFNRLGGLETTFIYENIRMTTMVTIWKDAHQSST